MIIIIIIKLIDHTIWRSIETNKTKSRGRQVETDNSRLTTNLVCEDNLHRSSGLPFSQSYFMAVRSYSPSYFIYSQVTVSIGDCEDRESRYQTANISHLLAGSLL